MIKIAQTSVKSNAILKKRALAGLKKLKSRQDLGFMHLPSRKHLVEASIQHGQTILKNYKKIVVLGTGGSSLGGLVLKGYSQSSNIDFFENVDGQFLVQCLKKLENLNQIHWIVISKSGNTIETLSQVNLISQFCNLKDHCTVVTELKSSLLSDWARKNKIPILEIPEDVGGRFSVLSPVGLLPATLMGLDVHELCDGALWSFGKEDLVCELVAQTILSWKRNEWITVFWIYSDFLSQFGPWTQQLWSESLGKKKNRLGKKAPRVSTPIVLRGTRDQHSMLQQLVEGQKDKFVWFLKVAQSKNSQSLIKTDLFGTGMKNKTLDQLFAIQASSTQQALNDVKIKTLTIQADELSTKTLGALFMLLELVIGTLGEVLNINAFDQPGVESGKKLTQHRLRSTT